MCIDQWSPELSDAACQQTGFISQLSTSSRYDFTRTNAEFWYLDQSLVAEGELLQRTGEAGAGRCRSKESVQVECAELVCGTWNLTDNLATLLVGGEADLEAGSQWPSLAVLFNVKRKASCTVSIITARHMLTSFTCVHDNSLNPLEWVVFAGPSGYSPTASESAQIKLVKNIMSHPWARRGQHLTNHDIAIIEIHDGLEFNSLVSPLCLSSDEIEDRQLCVTAGWTSSSEGISFNQYLTYLPESSLAQAECNSSSLYNGQLTPAMMCSMADGDSRVCHVSK